MTIHYHGTPISPRSVLRELAGRHFCVSFMRPDDIAVCAEIGQSLMLDNGAFSAWRCGKATDWPGFYKWADKWLDYPENWAVIPDVVTGNEDDQELLLREWPHGDRGAPVWHLHESLDRLVRLTEHWPRVCMGSSSEYSVVLSPAWCRRMDEAWTEIMRHHRRPPRIHMLRGMNTVGRTWPFASVDSTDIGRNHNRPQNTARGMADRWDAKQCPAQFTAHHQMELI